MAILDWCPVTVAVTNKGGANSRRSHEIHIRKYPRFMALRVRAINQRELMITEHGLDFMSDSYYVASAKFGGEVSFPTIVKSK
jgi:hypothetical protein